MTEMTSREYELSAKRGKVPAAHMDGLRPMAMDILRGKRVICCDISPENLVSYYSLMGDSIMADQARGIVAAVADGRLLAFTEENEGTYCLPGQEWRVMALEAVCDDNAPENVAFNACLIGILLGYSDDDINAFHHRLGWTVTEVNLEWKDAWDWLRGTRC